MGRKGHKKSRLGCTECKRRHLKCDETKPICVNCKTAGAKCSFEKHAPHLAHPSNFVPSASTSPDPPQAINFNHDPIKPISFRSPGNLAVNLDHLELLYNFQTEAFQSSVANRGTAVEYMETAIIEGFKHPFLMHAILAISSFHLSLNRPERAAFYQQLSSDLQALAVSGFNDIMMNVTDDNYIAAFLFSTMVAKHAFCQTFVSLEAGTDLGTMLNRITEALKMIRGISIVMNGFWEALSKSVLKNLFREGGYLAVGTPPDEECKPLREMLARADLSTKSEQNLSFMITELQRAFAAEKNHTSPEYATSTAFAWLVRSSEDYITYLQERRPEALIILAHYAVLLHWKRMSWTVRGAGRVIILAIKDYLGPHWTRWLEWPLASIDQVHQSSTGTPSTQEFHSPGSLGNVPI